MSLSCGCVDDLRLCNPEDSIKALDTLDPSCYSIEAVIDAAMKYCSIGITDNRWSDELFDRLNDHIESCMVFQFLHRNPYWLFGNERAEEAIWMVRRWTESNLDCLNRSALILLNSFFTYVKEVPWDEDESLSLHRRIGIALLQKGDPCYLSSEWVIKSIIREDGSLDMAEIHEFIAISDKKTVYSALANNHRLDNEIRLPLAEKAIELGSDTGRKVKAKIIFGDGSGDVLGAMRLMLQCEDLSETYLYIRECYEILSGSQYGDPMALELYRAEHKHSIPENILSELRKRFLD